MEDEVHRAAEHLLLAMRPSHNNLIIMGCASRGKEGGGALLGNNGVAPCTVLHVLLTKDYSSGWCRACALTGGSRVEGWCSLDLFARVSDCIWPGSPLDASGWRFSTARDGFDPEHEWSAPDARDVLRHGTLRNPDRPDQLLDQAATDKIRNYREPYAIGRWRFCLRACLPRGAFTASFCGCSTSLRTGKRLTASRPSAMSPAQCGRHRVEDHSVHARG